MNKHRLFREYNARLSNTLAVSELLATIKDIRQDNYARAQHPARYAYENYVSQRRGEQVRRPLTEREIQQLFISLAPTHYTDEMRAILLNHSGTAREKAEHIKGLESGAIAPSANLRLLLTEFEKTRSDSPIRFGRNIRAFLGDYLNPPTPGGHRFSAHDLYKLREKLSPAERDYFYKVVDGTRQSISSGEKIKQLGSRQAQLPVMEGRAEDMASRGNHERRLFDERRGQIEERVTAYLMSAVKARGIQTLKSDRESLDHAAQVTHIIKETITEKGHTLQDFRLTDERVATASGKLVGELPYALAANRNRELNQDFSLDQPRHRGPEHLTCGQSVREQQLTSSEPERGFDEEIVEQKVSRAVRQITEQNLSHDSGHVSLNGHPYQQHSTVSDIAINTRSETAIMRVPEFPSVNSASFCATLRWIFRPLM